ASPPHGPPSPCGRGTGGGVSRGTRLRVLATASARLTKRSVAVSFWPDSLTCQLGMEMHVIVPSSPGAPLPRAGRREPPPPVPLPQGEGGPCRGDARLWRCPILAPSGPTLAPMGFRRGANNGEGAWDFMPRNPLERAHQPAIDHEQLPRHV